MNKTCNLCRAKFSKDGKYIILPVRLNNGSYENAIISTESCKSPVAVKVANARDKVSIILELSKKKGNKNDKQ